MIIHREILVINGTQTSRFDPTGNYLHLSEDYPCPPWLANLANLSGKDGLVDATTQVLIANTTKVSASDSKPSKVDYEKFRPRLLWSPLDVVRKTFENTTQFACAHAGTRLKRFFQSPFPALHHPRRAEDVATDTVYADTPAIYNGATMAHGGGEQ